MSRIHRKISPAQRRHAGITLSLSLAALIPSAGWVGCSPASIEEAHTDSVSDALTTTLSPTLDTHVRDGASAGMNFGSSQLLEVQRGSAGNNREAYLKFPLSSINGTVQSAKLRVFGKLSQAGNVKVVARLLPENAFHETSTTYDSKPESRPIELGRVSVTSTAGAWYEFDVTSIVRQQKRAMSGSIDLMLHTLVQSSAVAQFNSKEGATNRPQLVVNTATALLVVGNTTLNAGDQAVRTRLSELGFAVTTKSAAAAITADASGRSLVLVSSTVAASDVTTKFRDVAVPVLTWENTLYDDMKMTGTVAGTDFGSTSSQTSVAISNKLHALAGGREGTTAVSGSNALTWGKPSASGLKIATQVGNSTRTAVFGYEKGAAMASMNAPERRVGLFLGDTTAASLTRSGWALFDAAVNWVSYSKPFTTKKVGIFIYDPILEAQPGQPRLSQFLGWPDPHGLARQAISEFAQTSGDFLRYQITTETDVDEWPLLEDGTRYTDQEYLDDYAQPPCTLATEVADCLSDDCIPWEEGSPDGYCAQNLNRPWANYPAMIAARGWDQGINNGTYDEVWVGGPRAIGFFESRMVGPGAITVNSDPVQPPNTVASKRYMIEFLDWTVPLSFFQHGFVHRIEWLMRYVYFEKFGQDALGFPLPSNWNTEPYDFDCLWGPTATCTARRRHLFDKFTLVDGVAQNLRAHGDPGAFAGVGAAHYVPGAQGREADNYNYGSVPAVVSNADDWMYNFPNLTGETRTVTTDEWFATCGGEHQCGFMQWFNNHLPRVGGRSATADGSVLLNWWEYAVNFDDYAETKP
jgi:hypothetical protein